MARPSAIQTFELQERMGELLGSQRTFIFAPEVFSVIAGGWGSGKTRAGIIKGLILSAYFPGNQGMILRYHGSDLEDSVIPLFFEVCPPSWIRNYNKKSNTVVLRNNSIIMFRHLHDAKSPTKSTNQTFGPKTRRVGANLGWFFIDQMEEAEESHWLAMIGRLRNPRAGKRFGFATINPNGHDWIWKSFFPTFRPWKRDEAGKIAEFYQVSRPQPGLLGVAVNSEENRVSNGGFVADSYYDNLLGTMPKEWIDRYVYCSFDDFTGKIYREYRAGLVQKGNSDLYSEDERYMSVHNIDAFKIPRDFELIVAIDVGGESPWAVEPHYIDYQGNVIVASGLTKSTVRIAEIANWIKAHLPWNESRTRFVIDPENKVASLELAEHGIHCVPAMKGPGSNLAGITRVAGYLHVQKGRALPEWYKDTQPKERWDRFKDGGSPRLFVFRNNAVWRVEHDNAVWDPNKPNELLKTKERRFDTVDATKYAVALRPDASKMMEEEEKHLQHLKKDPLSYREWSKFDKRVAERQYRLKGGGGLREADMDEIPDGPVTGEKAEYISHQEW